MDRLTAEHRSWLMSRVKGKDTKPEIIVRRLIFKLGYRYRLHVKNLPGKPDIVMHSRRKIIFVNGCFWHGHNCKYGQLPKTRTEFWRTKIENNRARDHKVLGQLEELGWDILVVWQCETKNLDSLTQKTITFLSTNDPLNR